MIAAVGSFEMATLVEALRSMASNSNPAYDHELRSEGRVFIHDCGWGVAYRDGDRLVRLRSARSFLDDPEVEALAGIRTDLAVLHARRTPDRGTIDVMNSHPFIEKWNGETWSFCHNGTVNDLTQLSGDGALVPRGSIDSERLFHHILTRIDTGDPASSLTETLGELRDFTCLNCFLATVRRVVAHARMAPDTTRPRYYALWHGRGEGFTLVSSESFDASGVLWMAVPDGSSLHLEA
jgi:predicted glutamine amidotransferase